MISSIRRLNHSVYRQFRSGELPKHVIVTPGKVQECPKIYLQYFPSPCSPYFNIWKGKQRWNTNSW